MLGDTMRKRPPKSYICLTLLKQDIRELVRLFQKNLQDVEIVIDDIRIIDSAQLEQFDAAYQAKSLIARGYCDEVLGQDASGKGKRRLVELKMSKKSAILLPGWNEVGKREPEVAVQIGKLLVRCQNRFQHWLIGFAYFFSLFPLIPLLPSLLQEHHVAFIAQLLLTVVGSLLMTPVFLFLLSGILRLLQMDTYVFMLPGAVRATQVYGDRETRSTLVVALVLFMVFSVSLIIAFSLLWR
jgi:hypothetical protein